MRARQSAGSAWRRPRRSNIVTADLEEAFLNARVNEQEMESRYLYYWHNMDDVKAPPPPIGSFNGAFRTIPWAGMGGDSVDVPANCGYRLSIEPWSKFNPLWSIIKHDININVGTDIRLEQNPRFLHHWIYDEVLPCLTPTVDGDNTKIVVPYEFRYDPSHTSTFQFVPDVDAKCQWYTTTTGIDTSLTEECRTEYAANTVCIPHWYSNVDPAKSGFTLDNEFAAFMGGYIVIRCINSLASSCKAVAIGQNEVRGIGQGVIKSEADGFPVNRGLGETTDPNRLDFAIDDKAFAWGGLSTFKPPETMVGTVSQADKETFFAIPVVPTCNGFYLMVGRDKPFTNLHGATYEGTTLDKLNAVDSVWMGVASRTGAVGAFGFSKRPKVTNPWGDHPDNFSLTFNPDGCTYHYRVIDQRRLNGMCPYFVNPGGAVNNGVVGDLFAGEVTYTHPLTSGMIEFADYDITDETHSAGPHNVGTYRVNPWVMGIAMDDSYRVRRATCCPTQALRAGMPQFEIINGAGGGVTLQLKYKFFYNYIADVNHPHWELAGSDNIADIDVDRERQVAASFTGTADSEEKAIGHAKALAIQSMSEKEQEIVSPQHPENKLVMPTPGIQPTVRHDEPNFFEKLIGGFGSMAKNVWDTAAPAAKWILRNNDSIASALTNIPTIGPAAAGMLRGAGNVGEILGELL